MTNEWPDASPIWYTIPSRRTVLAVVRTVTTTISLLDSLPDLLDDDPRVEVLFTVMPRQRDANFERGIRRLVDEAGVRLVAWEDAVQRRFDLIVTASYEGPLDDLSGPILMLRHGGAIGKRIALPDDGRIPLPADGESTSTMVLSHEHQAPYYVVTNPRTDLLVAGDLALDRMRASLPVAVRYREAFGVSEGMRLVVLTSTWGENSLIGTDPMLPARFLVALPHDEYRVALILHPNVWGGHSTWQIRAWMRDALDAGLVLLPPRRAWRAALVAADVVVGDHGSATLHAAALGKPVIMGPPGRSGEAVADGPMAELEATALRLNRSVSLRDQIEEQIADHQPDAHAALSARAFGRPGEAAITLRRKMYTLMQLDDPPTPPRVLTVDLPETIGEPVTALRVVATARQDGTVGIERFPAVLEHLQQAPPPPATETIAPEGHLLVEEQERDLRLLESATVIVRRGSTPDRRAWTSRTLRAFPGARVAVALHAENRHATVAIRDSATFEITRQADAGPYVDPTLAASALHVLTLQGPAALPTTVAVRLSTDLHVFSLQRSAG